MDPPPCRSQVIAHIFLDYLDISSYFGRTNSLLGPVAHAGTGFPRFVKAVTNRGRALSTRTKAEGTHPLPFCSAEWERMGLPPSRAPES